eukprot:403354042
MEAVENTQTLETIRYYSGEIPKPATNKVYPRIYSHNLCIFTERVRLAWAAKNLEFQLCEIDLEAKAPWHVAANGGVLPLIELQDDTLMPESRVLQDLANDLGRKQGLELYSEEPIQAAHQRLLMEQFGSKYMPAYFTLYRSKGKSEEVLENYKKTISEMESWLKTNLKGGKFLLGLSHPSMADIHIIPVLERLVMFENSVFDSIFKTLNIKEQAPTIVEFVHNFRQHEAFNKKNGFILCQERTFHTFLEDFMTMEDGVHPVLKLRYLD